MHGVDNTEFNAFRYQESILPCTDGNLLLQLYIDQGNDSDYGDYNHCDHAEYFYFESVHNELLICHVTVMSEHMELLSWFSATTE